MSLPPPVAGKGRRGGVIESEANGANPGKGDVMRLAYSGVLFFVLEGFEREPAAASGGKRQARRRDRERSERSESRKRRCDALSIFWGAIFLFWRDSNVSLPPPVAGKGRRGGVIGREHRSESRSDIKLLNKKPPYNHDGFLSTTSHQKDI